ncbi:MAG: hypothetical protein KAJ23_16760 [Maribacter sp.]|nr:hypothetical protein [Maribacter sp.]
MWEFFTEWSSDDPKWLVVLILVGGWGVWMGYRNHRDEEKHPWIKGSAIEDFRDNTRTVVFALALLYGFFELLRRLFLSIF